MKKKHSMVHIDAVYNKMLHKYEVLVSEKLTKNLIY